MKFSVLALALSTAVSAQSFSRTWNDPFIPQPINFEVRNAGGCSYQLVYERFIVDNRYDISYFAEYPDGTSKQVSSVLGSLPREGVWVVDGLTTDEYGYEVELFENACRNVGGVQPTTFRANFALKDGFTYQNRYTTGSFRPTTGQALPAVPRNVRVRAAPSGSSITWSAVPGATGYVVFTRRLINSELGPETIPFIDYRILPAGQTSFSGRGRWTQATVLTIGATPRSFTPIDDVEDVFPS